MRSTSFSLPAQWVYWRALPRSQKMAALKVWGHMAGVYAAMNLLDDPVWLALIFC
ncbi:hypothetical protein [Rhodoferax aquaticus]|uniref:hypothetical protein n=1 Tax=Rhodoferax aquaticus TaxID=2527691 RepID=UPI00143D5B62|nr:hypothetical protein [Rhodoferax aquaticus]